MHRHVNHAMLHPSEHAKKDLPRFESAGQTCNIKSAYADPRFDAVVDRETAYITRTILAVPLKDGAGNVIAVIQAVNKLSPEEKASQEAVQAAFDSFRIPADVVEAASIPISWSCFTEEDCRALETVADVTGGLLHKLTLQGLAAREKGRAEMMVNLVRQISTVSTTARLSDVVDSVISACYELLDAQRVTLFLVDETRKNLIIASSKDAEGVTVPIDHGIVGYCATTGMPVCIPDAYKDPRFDKAVDLATGFKTQSVLCVPIRDSNGDIVGVLQAINRQSNGASPFGLEAEIESADAVPPVAPTPRGITNADTGFSFNSDASNTAAATTNSSSNPRSLARISTLPNAEIVTVWPFTMADVEVMEGMAAHAAVALRSAQLLDEMHRAQRTTSALLDIVQSTASDSTAACSTVSSLVQKIIDAAYQLLDCERVTLYLVDSVKQELWMAVTKDAVAEGSRIPIGKGLAGYAAQTGQPLNIPDAYRDPRFDPSFDSVTGFRTKSVLVWPISFQAVVPGADSNNGQSVIAVLQAINKRPHSMVRMASNSLLRSKTRLGSLFVSASSGSQTSRLNSAQSARTSGRRAGGAALPPPAESTSFDRFDANDERAMGAFCAEVAVALKRRSVEAAFLKVMTDSINEGKQISDEFNVSLLALYTDAGTSARLHTSVMVRSSTVEKNLAWPTAIRLLAGAKRHGKKALKTVDEAMTESSFTGITKDAGAVSTPTSAAVRGFLSRTSSYGLPDDAALSLKSTISAGTLEDELIEQDDAILTWSFNVFDYPLVGVPQVMVDPVFPSPELSLAPTPSSDDIMNGEAYLVHSVLSMFRQYALLRRFNVDEAKFAHFLGLVRTRYPPNPFHNFYHAVSVLHATFLMLGTTSAGEMLSYRDIFAAMIAALGHDIDHPGHNNAYEMNSLSVLALTHNDDAVLERHHSHTLFRTLFDPKCDFLSALPFSEVKGMRQTIISAILNTDMTKHFGCVAELADRYARYQEMLLQADPQSESGALSGRSGGAYDSDRSGEEADADSTRRDVTIPENTSDGGDAGSTPASPRGRHSLTRRTSSSSNPIDKAKAAELGRPKSTNSMKLGSMKAAVMPFDRLNDEDRNELVSVIVHTADLSGQAYPRLVSNNWNARILAEFRAQVAKERAQGLPVAPFMASLDTPLACARLQHSFVSNIVLPLWQRVADLLPGLEEPVSNLLGAKLQFERDVTRFEEEQKDAASGATSAGTDAAVKAKPSDSTPLMPPRHMSSMASAKSIIVGDEDEEAKAVFDHSASKRDSPE